MTSTKPLILFRLKRFPCWSNVHFTPFCPIKCHSYPILYDAVTNGYNLSSSLKLCREIGLSKAAGKILIKTQEANTLFFMRVKHQGAGSSSLLFSSLVCRYFLVLMHLFMCSTSIGASHLTKPATQAQWTSAHLQNTLMAVRLLLQGLLWGTAAQLPHLLGYSGLQLRPYLPGRYVLQDQNR